MTSASAPRDDDPAPDGRIVVAHCIHGLGLGGAQQVIRHLVAASDPAAFRHVVYIGNDGVFRSSVEATGARVFLVRRRLPKLDPIWVLRLRARIEHDRVDVLHAHLFGDTLHGYLAAGGRIPVVATLHNAARNFTPLQLWAYRRLIPRCDAVVACSESARASFAELFGPAGPRIEFIPNGLDLPAEAAGDAAEIAALKAGLGLPPGARIIGASGRLVEQKGFRYLIEAFKLLCDDLGDPDLRLVILGSGPLLDDLRGRARELGMGERVVLPGFRADARRLISTFEVVVFSSLYEGLPVALLEAMANRRVIVATAAPGLAEVLQDEHDALLVPPCDPRRMSAALARALGDEALRRRLSAAARSRYESDYTAARMARRYESVYADVVGARRSNGMRAAAR